MKIKMFLIKLLFSGFERDVIYSGLNRISRINALNETVNDYVYTAYELKELFLTNNETPLDL